MIDKTTSDNSLQEQYDELLKKASAQPGVKEVMSVFDAFRLNEDSYRPYARVMQESTISSSSSASIATSALF